MTCPHYTNGYCSKYNKHIPPGYCEWKCHVQMPSLLNQAINATAAAGRVAVAAAKGDPVFVDDEEAGRRMAICKACDQIVSAKGRLRCKHKRCGCYLDDSPIDLPKTKLATENCPVGKW